ncbi:hypothetical protein ACMFMG_002130 [Clarireedia jacksonii]
MQSSACNVFMNIDTQPGNSWLTSFLLLGFIPQNSSTRKFLTMAPLSSPDQSRAIGILFVTVFFVILPPIAVALRFWARQIKNTALSANDYLIVAAVVNTNRYNSNAR